MCAVNDWWPRIRRIPLYVDIDLADGEAVLCRDQNNKPVRVTKPDYFHSDEEREAAIVLLEAFYSSQGRF
jgi:hypothetical protein